MEFKNSILLTVGVLFLGVAQNLLMADRVWEAIGTGTLGLGCIFLYSYLQENALMKKLAKKLHKQKH